MLENLLCNCVYGTCMILSVVYDTKDFGELIVSIFGAYT
jgi:hypothetical protein